MSPQRLALRTVLLARPRTVVAVLLVGASLCVLDLFAGHIASSHTRMEYQAVIGERLGHLALVPAGSPDPAKAVSPLAGGAPGEVKAPAPLFDPADAQRARRVAESLGGVALVVPQLSVRGIASSGARSALFHGEGMGAAGTLVGPGKLKSTVRNGIALSSTQAQALGVRNGGSVTLHGAAPDAAVRSVQAEVVDVFNGSAFSAEGRTVLMPLEMAQSLRDSGRIERLVVYLSEPRRLENRRDALVEALRVEGVQAEVRHWQEQSLAYQQERNASDQAFDSLAGMVFAVIAAAVAATISMNALERRREIGTLRALGMRSHAVFLMLVAEALWIAAIGILLSLMASGLIAWIANRAGLSATSQHPLNRAALLVELDFNRMLMAVVVVLAVSLLAALVPAFKAARNTIPDALAA